MRETAILVEQQPPQGVLVCDHAGLVINQFSAGVGEPAGRGGEGGRGGDQRPHDALGFHGPWSRRGRVRYRGTSLIRNCLPLGTYSIICLGPYGGPRGVGGFL